MVTTISDFEGEKLPDLKFTFGANRKNGDIV